MQVSRYLKSTAISFTIKNCVSSNTDSLNLALLNAKAKTPSFQVLTVKRQRHPPSPLPLKTPSGHSSYSYLPFPHLLLMFPFQSRWLSLTTGHLANVKLTKRKRESKHANDRFSKIGTKSRNKLRYPFTEITATVLKKFQMEIIHV